MKKLSRSASRSVASPRQGDKTKVRSPPPTRCPAHHTWLPLSQGPRKGKVERKTKRKTDNRSKPTATHRG